MKYYQTIEKLEQAPTFTKAMIERFKLNFTTRVVQIGSNDGALLQYFQRSGIPVLGIDPATSALRLAQMRGIPTLIKFFSAYTARELKKSGVQADLLIGSNPQNYHAQADDYILGLKIMLKLTGVLVMEADTLYAIQKEFALQRLTIFDVEPLTKNGSVRVYARRSR